MHGHMNVKFKKSLRLVGVRAVSTAIIAVPVCCEAVSTQLRSICCS